MIKLLVEGIHTNKYYDEYYEIHPITSSSTLIKTDKDNILVDTGTLAYRVELLKNLRHEGVEPREINWIINTHFHLDHTSNNTEFVNAKIVSRPAIFDLKTNSVEIFKSKELMKKKLPEGIEILDTPGHFLDHISVLYPFEGKNYVVAGDIIREDIIRGEGYSANGLSQTFFDSMRLVFEKADVIIPGHGRIIEGKLLYELKDILLTKLSVKHGFEGKN